MADQQLKNDWLTRTPKWVLLSGFWLAQGFVLYLLQALLYVSQAQVDGIPDEAGITHLWGVWPSWAEYVDMLITGEFAVNMIIAIVVITLAQLMFMLPVRRPGITAGKGKGLKRSLVTAGFVIAVLCLAALMGIGEALRALSDYRLSLGFDLPGGEYTAAGVVVVVAWAIATPVLFRFASPGPRERVLSRLARKLFMGTIVEVALLIPLDVMIRRKTDCYCWSGSYWALTLCGFVGVFALGPAIYLPLLAKRRATWYGGHCGVCGYDMGGNLQAHRCPECGSGWKTSDEDDEKAETGISG
ncbi:MAG: hypothetical protein KDA29_09665 [Phycisphaerales bacterium]|nr:hypothetical protein [Phycisphaerales bacterium]